MTWDHPGIGKQTKGRGPATKKAKRRRRERAAAQAEIESAAAARRVADRRHAGHNADDVASGGTLASSERPRLGGRKKDRY